LTTSAASKNRLDSEIALSRAFALMLISFSSCLEVFSVAGSFLLLAVPVPRQPAIARQARILRSWCAVVEAASAYTWPASRQQA
jgi:hypothetical protein